MQVGGELPGGCSVGEGGDVCRGGDGGGGVSSDLALLGVMPGLLDISLLCKPDGRSKAVILRPGKRFERGLSG